MRLCSKAAPLALALAVLAPICASGQTLPSGPLVIGDGRLTVGGDIAASFGPQDPGYFDFTDYEHSALRTIRLDLTAALKTGDHVSILGDLRTENGSAPRPYALYLRIRPWSNRSFDIQAGRVPPAFGSFARRTYATDNILIGYPLAYQYLTSLRADAVPASADELLRMRGRGWMSKFSIGNTTPDRGVPLVSAFTWETGVQAHGGTDLIDGTVSLTLGSLAFPELDDGNDGRQLSGRVTLHPATGLVLGASAARGPFVDRQAARAAVGPAEAHRFTQTAWGADAEYSRDYYLVRVEMILSDWNLPIVRAPVIHLPLRALSTSVEGRYKLGPGMYLAGRFDHLGFSEISGSTRRDTWEAPVTRVEAGGGYSLQRNLVLKISYQWNTRTAGRVRTENLAAAQILYWF